MNKYDFMRTYVTNENRAESSFASRPGHPLYSFIYGMNKHSLRGRILIGMSTPTKTTTFQFTHDIFGMLLRLKAKSGVSGRRILETLIEQEAIRQGVNRKPRSKKPTSTQVLAEHDFGAAMDTSADEVEDFSCDPPETPLYSDDAADQFFADLENELVCEAAEKQVQS